MTSSAFGGERKRLNRVWHMDLLSLQILWRHLTVAVILDGFWRRPLWDLNQSDFWDFAHVQPAV